MLILKDKVTYIVEFFGKKKVAGAVNRGMILKFKDLKELMYICRRMQPVLSVK